MISISCPHCGVGLNLGDEWAGQVGKCNKCGGAMQVPAPAVEQTIVVHVPSNGMGTAGFVLSLIGFFTCGLLSPIGLFFSLLGLGKRPQGLAITGVVLGVIGSAWIPLFTYPFLVRFTGVQEQLRHDAELRQAEEEKAAAEKAIREAEELRLKKASDIQRKMDELMRTSPTPSP